MKYDAQAFIDEALETGFSQARELNVSALVFMPEVREMCAADRCGQYGKSWSCPPACGSVDDSAKIAADYSFGIIVQTIGKMRDDFDYENIQATSDKHKDNFSELIERLRSRYDILPMGAGACDICGTCSYPDAP
ncbi:MAG: DUF2284 domain-containing protein, partial [Clostridiales Family XIII bacterium]|nr:DUF2284 domain-containing protein [Clostridiales Family XIII bacterium]